MSLIVRLSAHTFFVVAYVAFSVIWHVVQEDNEAVAATNRLNSVTAALMGLLAICLTLEPTAGTAAICLFIDGWWLHRTCAMVNVGNDRVPAESSFFSILGAQAAIVALHFLLSLNETIRFTLRGPLV